MNNLNTSLGSLNHDQLVEFIETQTKTIVQTTPEVFKRLSGNSVHTLRIAIRKTRAALWCSRHSSAPLHFRKLNRRLRKLGNALGQVRELDVAIVDAKHYGIGVSQLMDKRKKFQKSLKKLIDHQHTEKLVKQICKATRKIDSNDSILFNEASDTIREVLRKSFSKKIQGRKQFHQLRITVKKSRYSLEAMGESIEPLRRLQNTLGSAHDVELLQKFTGKTAKLKAIQTFFNHKAILQVRKMTHLPNGSNNAALEGELAIHP